MLKLITDIEQVIDELEEENQQKKRLAEIQPIDLPQELLERCTDSSNSMLLNRLYGDKLRFDHQRRRWLVWRDHWWAEDSENDVPGMPSRLALEVAKKRYFAAGKQIEDHKVREAVAKFAIQSEQRKKIVDCVELAKTRAPISNNGLNWDKDPLLFGVKNGVIDLKTGELRNGKPEDRITKHSPIVFNPSAECPRWAQFLNEIFEGNNDMINFVRRAAGYSMQGSNEEQCFFILQGAGSNGKGVFIETLRYVFGDYGVDAGFQAFAQSSAHIDSHPESLANLAGKRFVTVSEVRENSKLNEQRLKVLSHGDTCSARHLNQKSFQFMPGCKIWLSMNRRPRISDDSHGFWRSVRTIHFNRQFKEDADFQLTNKLKAEASGILKWAVDGCRDWQNGGLMVPEEVKEATKEYQLESDPLAEFFETCTEDSPGYCTGLELWEAYGRYCDGNKVPEKERVSRRKFSLRLGDKYKRSKQRVNGKVQRVFEGVALSGVDGC